jgi:hypothetical protein
VPFPPGGSTDLIARTLAPKLQEKLGGTFIIGPFCHCAALAGQSSVRCP